LTTKNLGMLTLAFVGMMSAARFSSAAPLPQLQAGDVLLLELQCYVCRIIGASTSSLYNHSGLVITVDGNDIRVAQSLSSTEMIPLAQFLGQTRSSALLIRRPLELSTLKIQDPAAFADQAVRLRAYFAKYMQGRAFDSDYLWNNVDENGQELLYCSEMVQKTLNSVLGQPLPTRPLDFSKAWDFWLHYFRGQPPQGEPGNSPAVLAESTALETIFARP